MQKLYLVRHGETADNQDGLLSGQREVALSRVGEQMAWALADAYAHIPFAAIYASTLLRAQETAKPLSERLGLRLQLESGLAELSYGAWEGLKPAQAAASDPALYATWKKDPSTTAPPSGESAEQVERRAVAVLEALHRRHETGDVLCVSHKCTIRILICSLLCIDLRHFKNRLAQPSGGVSIVGFEDTGPRLLRLGDTSHLPPEIRENLPE